MSSLRVPVLLWCVAFGVAGCFESGPLGTSDAALTHDTPVPPADTGGDVDTTPPTDAADAIPADVPDSAEPADADAVDDTTPPQDVADTTPTDTATDAGPDSADVPDVPDTASPPDVTGPPCLTVNDCAPGGSDNMCAGSIGCVDYKCVVDPATVVVCDNPGDPCFDVACEPTTGECVSTPLCVCDPPTALTCGQSLDYNTAETGTTAILSDYSCGAAAPGDERLFRFTVPTDQRIRLDLDSTGTAGVRVVTRTGTTCTGSSCVAGGISAALFDAVAGVDYVVAVEHAQAAAAVSLAITCDVTDEIDCNDLIDDDGDSMTDCDDPGCAGIDGCPPDDEIDCNDGIDEDLDNQTDCEDPGCASAVNCLPPSDEIGACFDDIDNDSDSQTDCADMDCWDEPDCLQSCVVNTPSTSCGFQQGGVGIGGGKTNSSEYPCGPDAPGKEVTYRWVASGSGTVTVSILNATAPVGLYVIEDMGLGCTPLHCVAHSTSSVTFSTVSGQTWYFVVDSPEGASGIFTIRIDCNF